MRNVIDIHNFVFSNREQQKETNDRKEGEEKEKEKAEEEQNKKEDNDVCLS